MTETLIIAILGIFTAGLFFKKTRSIVIGAFIGGIIGFIAGVILAMVSFFNSIKPTGDGLQTLNNFFNPKDDGESTILIAFAFFVILGGVIGFARQKPSSSQKSKEKADATIGDTAPHTLQKQSRKLNNQAINDNDTGPKLTESQTQELIAKIKREQRLDTLKSMMILIIVILLPVIIYKVLSFFL